MGRLYDIIQAHIDTQPYAVSVRQVATAIGVSPTTVSNWRNPKELPRKEHLEAIAQVTGRPYDEVLYAAMFDAGYVVETVVSDEELVRRRVEEWRAAAGGGIPDADTGSA